MLLVEDELLIGMDLMMVLESWGFEVEGPHASCEMAIQSIHRKPPDLAILDVNLGRGETSLAIAAALDAIDRPFVFLTGYSPSRYANHPEVRTARHLRKPVSERALRGLLEEMLPAPE